MEYKTFVENALHDLRNCIMLTEYSIRNLKKYDESEFEKSSGYLKRIASSVESISTVVKQQGVKLRVSDVQLNNFTNLFKNFISKQQYQVPKPVFLNHVLGIHRGVYLRYEKNLFEQIFYNIMDNSSKSKSSFVNIRVFQESNHMIIAFKDNGGHYKSEEAQTMGIKIIESNAKKLDAKVKFVQRDDGYETLVAFKLFRK